MRFSGGHSPSTAHSDIPRAEVYHALRQNRRAHLSDVSGFFYDRAVPPQHEYRQIKKVLRLVLKATVLYVLWILLRTLPQPDPSAFLKNTLGISASRVLLFVFTNDSSISEPLWYMWALLYVLGIAALTKKLKIIPNDRFLRLLTAVLLGGNLLLGKYDTLLFGIDLPVEYSRNFLFCALPCFCLGILIRSAYEKQSYPPPFRKTAVSVSVLLVLSCFERFLLSRFGLDGDGDIYLFTVPLAVSVFQLFLQVYQTRKPNRVENVCAEIGRRYSTWIYLIHSLLIWFVNGIMSRLHMMPVYQYIAPFVVFAASTVFAILYAQLKDKNRIKQKDMRC